MKKELILALGIIFVFLISFIYITASGITQLSNEKILFLFLDETRGEPGTVEVASLGVYEHGSLSQPLIKVNPLASTDALKREGISILDSLIKAKSQEEGLEYIKTIAEHETNIEIDRMVLIDSSAFKSMIDAVRPVPIDLSFSVEVLDTTYDLKTRYLVTGENAQHCIKGIEYPGIYDEDLMQVPEDYLWEVKAEIINDVGNKVLDLDTYTKREQEVLASTVITLYKQDQLSVYKRNTVLTMVYYLPESISKTIVNFAVRRLA